jgi:AcrR family transcriptional regulator
MTNTLPCQIAGSPLVAPRPAGRPRLDSLPGRRRALLDSARLLFIERGFHEVSLALIARHARVALRTIYQQYDSKEGLLRHLIGEESAMHAAELEALRLDEKPFRAQLDCLAQHLAARICRRRLVAMHAAIVATRNPSLLEAFDEAGPAHIRRALTRILQAGPAAHRPRDADGASFLCEHFLACVAGGRLEAARPAAAAAERARRGLALFLQALAN